MGARDRNGEGSKGGGGGGRTRMGGGSYREAKSKGIL